MTQRTAAQSESPQGEADLRARLRAGEDAAYEELLRLYSGRMLAVARRFMGSEDDALEAVQEAFVSAFRAMGRFEGESRLSTWLHRIVVNACLMKLRTRRRKPEESIDDLLPSFRENGHMEVSASGWSERADSMMERTEVREWVRKAIERLPEAYRTVLLLRDIEEYDTERTAEALGLTKAAVKTRLHRARQALRQLLEVRFSEELRADAATEPASREGEESGRGKQT